jgi:hypothetical protein
VAVVLGWAVERLMESLRSPFLVAFILVLAGRSGHRWSDDRSLLASRRRREHAAGSYARARRRSRRKSVGLPKRPRSRGEAQADGRQAQADGVEVKAAGKEKER